MKVLIRHIVLSLIWISTVCLCPIKRTLGLYRLMSLTEQNYSASSLHLPQLCNLTLTLQTRKLSCFISAMCVCACVRVCIRVCVLEDTGAMYFAFEIILIAVLFFFTECVRIDYAIYDL